MFSFGNFSRVPKIDKNASTSELPKMMIRDFVSKIFTQETVIAFQGMPVYEKSTVNWHKKHHSHLKLQESALKFGQSFRLPVGQTFFAFRNTVSEI